MSSVSHGERALSQPVAANERMLVHPGGKLSDTKCVYGKYQVSKVKRVYSLFPYIFPDLNTGTLRGLTNAIK